ncbi:MAG: histidinol-phosphatase [Treponema sp.]|nr:histidinol-phosphatase [Candidatus Treponema equifaecale]
MKTNFHIHTVNCHGKNTIEETALKAIDLGFTDIGFSCHAMLCQLVSDWHMKEYEIQAYCDVVHATQKKFGDKINIQLGFEVDYIPGLSLPSFDDYRKFKPDYLIGSVHYIYTPKGTFPVDDSVEILKDGINRCFNGDIRKCVQRYFELEREMLQKGKFSIIGHCDLIRKLNKDNLFFDENENWYKKELVLTSQEIRKAGVIAEINTGAIARGFMTDPYPSDYFMQLLYNLNVPVTIDGDSHGNEQLNCAFDLAEGKAKKAGYTAYQIPGGKIIEL